MAIAWTCVLAAVPLSSQANQRSGTSHASATMHVTVTLVPVALTPSAKQAERTENTVTYNVPMRPARVTVREELRQATPHDGLPFPDRALVRVKTVVAE